MDKFFPYCGYICQLDGYCRIIVCNNVFNVSSVFYECMRYCENNQKQGHAPDATPHRAITTQLKMAPYRIKRFTPAEVLAAVEVRAAAETDNRTNRRGSTPAPAFLTAAAVGASAAPSARDPWAPAVDTRANSSADSHAHSQDHKRQRPAPQPAPPVPLLAPSNPRALTAELGKARTLSDLLYLHRRHAHHFDNFHLGAFWSKFKKIFRGELGGLRGPLAPVCELTVQMLFELSAREVSNVAHAFAKARLFGAGPWESVWTALPQAMHRRLDGFNAQDLSNTVWAFATAGIEEPALFEALSAQAARRGLRDFREQHLSNTAWAFAKSGREAPALFEAISAEAGRRGLRGFTEQHLSITAWAFAKSAQEAPALFEAISAEAGRRGLNGFNSQELSNTAWAFAKSGHEAPALFEAISTEAGRRGLGCFSPQNMSNTAWAFVTSGHEAPALFEAISTEAVRRRLGGFNPQELSNTAWAFAKSGHEAPALFEAISAEAGRRGLGGFNSQELSNTAWAFAKSGHEAPALFEAISTEAGRRGLGCFNPQNLSNTAWAFAKSGHEAPALLDALSAETMRRGLGGFNPQDLSTTAWAFATACHTAPEMFKTISAELLRRGLGSFNAQNITNTAWAFAVLDPPSADALFSTTCFSTRCASLETSFSLEQLTQLHQWSLWRKERRAPWPGLHESLRQACRNACFEEDGQPSRTQSEVVREIRSRGFDVDEEQRCQISGYSLDALVVLNDGERIAVEVDGPSPFIGRSHTPTGATQLKHRQLRHFGWRLESVPYWEWDHSNALPWLPRSSR